MVLKQRQVDVLTKSSLRLPIDHTVIYIHGDLEITSGTQNYMERQRIEMKGIEQNRRDHELEWNRMEERRKDKQETERDVEHTRKCCRPTGGWAMRARTSTSYKAPLVRQVDRADQPWDAQVT